ncbi:MAG: 23S rRNA (adenine(2030)-N(6))-methyltransferase RlmJ [Candidatus Nitrosoglobus sp.]
MLSYRHAFHVGNHADVLKHVILVHLLRYLSQKEKPLWYIDTHAGAAIYTLDEGYATKNKEYKNGIGRLWARQDIPKHLLVDYIEQVCANNPDNRLRYYPGSPQLAIQILRKQDRLRMFELHSTESAQLQQHFRSAGSQVIVQASDGFSGLQSLLPPPSRRGLVLIDPPYEDKRDYQRVLIALRESLKRFKTGVYVVWYPQLQNRESYRFPARLKQLPNQDWLHVTLTVKSPEASGFGLYGSGIFILNPSWKLPEILDLIMPYLVEVLGQDASADFNLEWKLA